MDLRHYLFENNMTNGAFAKKAGLCAQYITQLKLKRATGTIDTLKKIILAADGQITPEDLIPELYEAWERAKNPPLVQESVKKSRGRPKKEKK